MRASARGGAVEGAEGAARSGARAKPLDGAEHADRMRIPSSCSCLRCRVRKAR
jgi:hypothetical protein